MKDIIRKALFLTGLGLLGASVFAQGNMNAEMNRAISLSNDCWRPFMAQHSRVEATLASQGRCLNGSTSNTYNITVWYSCPPQYVTICLPAPPRLSASVTFDCDGNASVTCLPE